MKKFVIFWDDSYDAVDKSKVVDENFFHVENGFFSADSYRIKALHIGESHPLDNAHVWVLRVK